MKQFLIYILCISFFQISAQLDIEGTQLNLEESIRGYTMFENFSQTYLVDNCGQVVNTWPVNNTHLHTKLTEEGHLIYIKDGTVFVRDWDNVILGTIRPISEDIGLVYEVIELPNKNFLCLARQEFSRDQFDEIGYEIDIEETPTRIDAVVELDRETGEIVWRWNLSDHVIQERDHLLPNYGSIQDNPQLLNMDAVLKYDWAFTESFMINGMDYNAELDQIVLSIRKMNEIAVIDHSTTTEEAAGSTGGNSGMGGDILYRWGNPQNYQEGSEDDHRLYYQHNPNWIHYGEHAGSIIMFNNGLSREGNFSEAFIIDPPIDSNGHYTRENGQPYAPSEPSVIYSQNTTDAGPIFSGYTSGAKVLPNGNIFITEGDEAILREFTPDGILVWQYHVPNTGYIFRTVRYSPDFPGFVGKDMTPSDDVVEDIPSGYQCNIFSSIEDIIQNDPSVTISQINDYQLLINNIESISYKASVINVNGQEVRAILSDDEEVRLDLSDLYHGIYFLQISDTQTGHLLATSRVNL